MMTTCPLIPATVNKRMVKIYGIKNCDTMKKAFAWCESHNVRYEFHDFKKLGVPHEKLAAWCETLDWKTLLNTRGTTFRKLPPERQAISTPTAALTLMMEFPSAIKRPVVETGDGKLLVGFDPSLFESFVR